MSLDVSSQVASHLLILRCVAGKARYERPGVGSAADGGTQKNGSKNPVLRMKGGGSSPEDQRTSRFIYLPTSRFTKEGTQGGCWLHAERGGVLRVRGGGKPSTLNSESRPRNTRGYTRNTEPDTRIRTT